MSNEMRRSQMKKLFDAILRRERHRQALTVVGGLLILLGGFLLMPLFLLSLYRSIPSPAKYGDPMLWALLVKTVSGVSWYLPVAIGAIIVGFILLIISWKLDKDMDYAAYRSKRLRG